MDCEMINFYKILILLTTFFVNIGFAQQNKVLIINTDSSLPRYRQMATEFSTVLKKEHYKLVELNMAEFNSTDTESQLEKLIQVEEPSAIYCIGSKAYLLAKDHTKDIPLFFSAAINWQRLGTNDKTYGVTNELSPEQELMILRDLFPNIKKIGLFYSNEVNREYVEAIKQKTATFNMQLIAQEISANSSKEEIKTALDELLGKVDLFWMISDPVVFDTKDTIEQIFRATKQQQKPVYAYSNIYIKYGAVLAVSADDSVIGRQVANMILMLLDNKNLTTPIQRPLGSEISLNLCIVEQLGMTLNKYALDSVNTIVNCNDK